MTLKELDEIEARANAASVGPWIASSKRNFVEDCDYEKWEPDSGEFYVVSCGQLGGDGKGGTAIYDGLEIAAESLDDAKFLAAAREDVPKLCAALRDALEEIRWLKK